MAAPLKFFFFPRVTRFSNIFYVNVWLFTIVKYTHNRANSFEGIFEKEQSNSCNMRNLSTHFKGFERKYWFKNCGTRHIRISGVQIILMFFC